MTKVALITGASSGIGRATATALSKVGWNIVITARRLDQLEETKTQCGETSKVLVLTGDISDERFVLELFKQTVSTFGRLDLLFNNAGMGCAPSLIEDLPIEAFRAVMNVNVTSAVICTREAFRIFKTQNPPGGRIINNGSLSAHTPRPHSFPYTISKHATTGLTKATALEGRAHRIACTQIDIGNALTDMSFRLSQGALQSNGQTVAEATFDVEHVAQSIVHIASLPTNVTVLDYKIMATEMPFVGRG